MEFVILDTETTGSGADDRVIQLAYLVSDGMNLEPYTAFCKPDKPISFGAMAVHHITPEMISDKPKLVDTEAYHFLEELNTEENCLVIHNAPFDIGMLEKDGFKNKMKVIDTLKVVRHLAPDLNSHALQYLRYHRGLYREEHQIEEQLGMQIAAHDAFGDIVVLFLLFKRLLQAKTAEEMIEISALPSFMTKFRFGKYNGQLIADVARKDRSYCEWLLYKAKDLKPDLKHTLEYLLENK